MSEAVISFRGVTKRFGARVALEDVDLNLPEGGTLGIVGESGSGKTTCTRLALGLEVPSAGSLSFGGIPYPRSRRALRQIRRRIGFVFQDPYDALDPRMTIGDIVGEPLRIHGERSTETRVEEVLAAVGLPDAKLHGYPAEYSGGGRQRIAIARALILEPDVLVCDEPTASLDVSVQAQIVNLLMAIREARHLSVIFVSHDLDLVKKVATEVAVLYAGRVLEVGPAGEVATHPRHPYTLALLSAMPADHPSRRRIVSTGGDAQEETEGAGIDRGACVFAPRCPRVRDRCRAQRPLAVRLGRTEAACFFPLEVGDEVAPAGAAVGGTRKSKDDVQT